MADTPQQIGLHEVRERVQGLGQPGATLDEQIQQLVNDLNQHQLYVSPEHDLEQAQAGIREKIEKILEAEGVLSPEVSGRLRELGDLIDRKVSEMPTEPEADDDNVIDLNAEREKRGTSEDPREDGNATENGEQADEAQTAETNESAKASAKIETFLRQTFEDETALSHPITDIIRRKLARVDDLEDLSRHVGSPSVILSERASQILNPQTNEDKGKYDSVRKIRTALKTKEADLKAATEEQEDARAMTGTGTKAAELKDAAMKTARTRAKKARNEVEALKEVLEFRGGKDTYAPKQLLLMINSYREPGETKSNIARKTDNEIEQARGRIDEHILTEWGLGLAKPTLKETLNVLREVKGLEEVKKEQMEELAEIAKNKDDIKKWIVKLEGGEAAYTEKVPALLAYLEAALVDGKGKTRVNRASRAGVSELVRNLKRARNEHFAEKAQTEHPGDNEKAMFSYISMLNRADENKVEVTMELLDEAVRSSYLKSGVKLGALGLGGYYAIGAYGAAAAGLGGLSGALGSIPLVGGYLSAAVPTLAGGWKLGGITALLVARTQADKLPKKTRTYFKQGTVRAAGTMLLGLPGIFAPEIYKGLTFAFRHRTDIKKGAETAGGVARGAGKVVGSIGKAATAPIRAIRRKAA